MKKRFVAFSFFIFLLSPYSLANPIQISASELFKEYEKNEVRADQYYKGKQLLVTGKVESISSNLFDEPEVNLKTSSFFGFVNVEFKSSQKNRVLDLDKGQSIQILCTGAGEVLGFPMLTDCIFYDQPKNIEIKTEEEKLRTQLERKLKAEEAKLKAEQNAKQQAEKNTQVSNFLYGESPSSSRNRTNENDTLKKERSKIMAEIKELEQQKSRLEAQLLTAAINTKDSSDSQPFNTAKLNFQDGLAYFQNNNGLYGFIDRYGNVVIQPQYKGAGGFYNGRAVVKDRHSNLWGYIDKQNNWIIRPRYCMAGRFSEGLAAVYINGRTSNGKCVDGKWGFIDTSGKMVIPAKYERVWAFSNVNGNIIAKFEHGGYSGYINKKGEWVK